MKKITSAFVCLLLCVFTTACQNISYWHSQTSVFFGISFTVDFIGENKSTAYDQMLSVLDEVNKQVNVNVADVDILAQGDNPSDILRLNLADANEEVQVGYHAYFLLKTAKELYTLTEGAFNVATYPLTYLWGVDALSLNYFNNQGMGSFENAPVPPSFVNSSIRPQFKPTRTQIEQIIPYCNLDNLTVYEGENGEYFAKKAIKELMVDLGAIAKGYSADLCAEIAINNNLDSALIDISGNLFMVGKMYNNGWKDVWSMSLREPKAYSNNVLCKFQAQQNTTAVTSGNYERTRYLVNDLEDELDVDFQHVPHIIDANRGVPYSLNIVENEDGEWDYINSTNHVISATIIGNNSMYADVFSTTACVMGVSKSIVFFESIKNDYDIKSLIFTADKKYVNIKSVQLIQTEQYDAYKQYQQIQQIGN